MIILLLSYLMLMLLDFAALDFFGALRAATYDSQIREWIVSDVIGMVINLKIRQAVCISPFPHIAKRQGFLTSQFTGGEIDEDADMKDLGSRLLKKQDLPEFKPLQLTLDSLAKEGSRLAKEQQLVNDFCLSQEYMKDLKKSKSGGLIGLKG